MIKVSVIIPTYKRARLLGNAIRSILSQSYKNFEVIVVDDDIDELSGKVVVDNFNDNRLRYLVNSRKKGANGARNTGIIAASGEYLAFLDDDDEWLSDKLLLQLNLMLEKKIQISGTEYCMDGMAVSFEEEYSLVHLLSRTIATPTLMLLTNIAKDVLFDENLSSSQELDFEIRCFIHVKNLKCMILKKVVTKVNNQTHARISNREFSLIESNEAIENLKPYLQPKYYELYILKTEWMYFNYLLKRKKIASINQLIRIALNYTVIHILKSLYFSIKVKILGNKFRNSTKIYDYFR